MHGLRQDHITGWYTSASGYNIKGKILLGTLQDRLQDKIKRSLWTIS